VTDKRQEQIAFPNQSRYYRERRPVRHIPTKEQLAADPSYSGHQAGIHPEHRPYSSTELSHSKAGMRSTSTHTPDTFGTEGDYELEEDDAYYHTRLPTSARRYQGYEISPEQVYQSGNQRYHVRYVDVPKRSSQQKQLPTKHQRDRYIDEVETTPPKGNHHKRSIHPFLYVGVGMIAMLALAVLVFSGWNWLQITLDDWHYGRPRTSQIDFVVGHNDSPANPSHFIALNLNRHVQVIEIPGGDSTKERTFSITTLFGDGQDLTPVTLSFRDLTGNGKPDMLIHIENQTLVMINDNGTFRPAKPGEVKGLL